MGCLVLKSREHTITQKYGGKHSGIDIVRKGYLLDYITAHSDGVVVDIQDGLKNRKGSTGRIAWGNFIKLDHGNGYYTLYAHLRKGLTHKKGDKVKRGEILGYMSDSGNAYGGHLHFEVYKGKTRIDPIIYLTNDFVIEKEEPKQEEKPKEEKVYPVKTVSNCYFLNLRKTPGYGLNVYKVVKKGTKVTYLGMSKGWAKIKYDNKTLYCGKKYLK